MPSLKIYPPTRLPSSGITETQFNMWQEELEVYISQEPDFKVFLPSKLYENWTSYEENSPRIPELKQNDTVTAGHIRNGRAITDQEAEQINDDKLDNIRDNLRTVLSLVGKCVSEGHYTSVIKHSTSLNWIYEMLRRDYDIQSKGVHFFNVLEVKFDASKNTPVAFYNMYRTIISNNLAKQGDVLKYKNNEVLDNDERFSPMLEDIVLLDVIREIDSRLPMVVKNFYFHKMKKDERLMDFKTDILLNIPHFLEQLNSGDNEEIVLSTFKTNRPARNQFKKKTDLKSRPYCRLCYLSKQSRDIFSSHNFGNHNCPSLTAQDRKTFYESAKLSTIQDEYDSPEVDDEEIAEMHGYSQLNTNDDDSNQNDVRCGYIQPTASQILTVFVDNKNSIPFHIDLDSGATVSFIREDITKKFKF